MAETSASTSWTKAGLVSVGRVSGAHGVKGQLRIGLDADDADTLRDVTRLVLAGERPDAPDSRYEIESLGALHFARAEHSAALRAPDQ